MIKLKTKEEIEQEDVQAEEAIDVGDELLAGKPCHDQREHRIDQQHRDQRARIQPRQIPRITGHLVANGPDDVIP